MYGSRVHIRGGSSREWSLSTAGSGGCCSCFCGFRNRSSRFTVVCKFDQPTDKDAVLIMHLPDMARTFTEIRGVFGRKIFEKPDPVFARERLFLFQTVDELFHRCANLLF